MIVGIIKAFNECATISDAIYSLAEVVDKIVLLDGAWEDFVYHGKNGSSDDGTIELFEKYKTSPEQHWKCKEFLIETRLWRDEKEKDEYIFKYCKNKDWVFILNGFECLIYNLGLREIKLFEKDLKFDVGSVVRLGTNIFVDMQARLFKIKNGKFGNKNMYVPIVVLDMSQLRDNERIDLETKYVNSKERKSI